MTTETLELVELKKSTVILAFLTFVTVPISLFLNLYSLSYLWLWFVVPLGAPVLGMLHIWGLLIIKNILTMKLDAKHDPYIGTEDETLKLKRTNKLLKEYLTKAYTIPLAALGLGYIVSLYI